MVKNVAPLSGFSSRNAGYFLVGTAVGKAAGLVTGVIASAAITYSALDDNLEKEQTAHTITLKSNADLHQQFNKFKLKAGLDELELKAEHKELELKAKLNELELKAEYRELKLKSERNELKLKDEINVRDYSDQTFILNAEWMKILAESKWIHSPEAYEDHALKLERIVKGLTVISGRNEPGSLSLSPILVDYSQNALKIINKNIDFIDRTIIEGKQQGKGVKSLEEQREIFVSQASIRKLILDLADNKKK